MWKIKWSSDEVLFYIKQLSTILPPIFKDLMGTLNSGISCELLKKMAVNCYFNPVWYRCIIFGLNGNEFLLVPQSYLKLVHAKIDEYFFILISKSTTKLREKVRVKIWASLQRIIEEIFVVFSSKYRHRKSIFRLVNWLNISSF